MPEQSAAKKLLARINAQLSPNTKALDCTNANSTRVSKKYPRHPLGDAGKFLPIFVRFFYTAPGFGSVPQRTGRSTNGQSSEPACEGRLTSS